MTGTQDDQDLRQEAEKRVEAKMGFRNNLISYTVVNTIIFIIWLVTALLGATWFPWFIFPLVGWGIGLGFHAWEVYGEGSKMQESMVQKEIEKMKAGKSDTTGR